ncbi:MAG: 16S rRNA (cytidine(1402)-2'-O)-methyltransferase [Thermoanaerobaculum sp.]
MTRAIPPTPAPGTLFVVATPIGTLADLSPRARGVLASVAVILAEDTRRTGKLLAAAGISTKLLPFHEHNERKVLPGILAKLEAGMSVALVSDAGTPLLCDPGYRLVRACRLAGLPVAAVPGPSAVTAALSVAGLPPYPFTFLGFLPPKGEARKRFLRRFAELDHTLVVFLSPHRLSAELADCAQVLGGEREACLLAELSKVHERGEYGTLGALAEKTHLAKGEFTLVVGPPPQVLPKKPQAHEAQALVSELLAQGLSPGKAKKLAAEKLGVSKKKLYQLLEAAKSEA